MTQLLRAAKCTMMGKDFYNLHDFSDTNSLMRAYRLGRIIYITLTFYNIFLTFCDNTNSGHLRVSQISFIPQYCLECAWSAYVAAVFFFKLELQ